MHYMIAFSEPASEFAKRNDPVEAGPYWGAWNAYIGALGAAGVIVSGNGLQPPETATMVSLRDGQRRVHDGPYADTKEQLGGYFILDVPDLDAAIEWALRSPAAAVGHLEVRPVMPPPAAA
jgi:hypothetical protein